MNSAPRESECEFSPGPAAPGPARSFGKPGAGAAPQQPAGRARKPSEANGLVLERRAQLHAVGWMAMCLEI